MLVHGFAAEKTENGLFPPLAQALAMSGFAVLAYDWRGLGQSDGTFAKTKLDDHVSDFRDAVPWFQHEYNILPSHLTVVGFSLGATIIALSMKDGFHPRSAIFLSPALRPAQDMWPRYDTPEIHQALNRDNYLLKNSVQVGRPFLESLRDTDLAPAGEYKSPVPLLVCHGTADERIPFETSRLLFGQNNSLATLRIFNGASHSFRPENPHRQNLAQTMCDWLACNFSFEEK